jgi:hypothetical protein
MCLTVRIVIAAHDSPTSMHVSRQEPRWQRR